MIWWLGLSVLLVAFLVPILIVLRDPARRTPRLPLAASDVDVDPGADELGRRVMTLEDELDELSRGLNSLRDEVEVLQRLVEDTRKRG